MRDCLTRLFSLLIVFPLLALTACSIMEDKAGNESQAVDMVKTPDEIIRYYESLRKQPASQLGWEYEKVRKNFLQEKNDANRTRLILFLILPGVPFHDPAAALNLLNEWPKDTQLTPGLAGFRSFLTPLLTEIQSFNQNINETSHKTHEMSQRIGVISQKLKEEQARSEILQNQINDLKSMEKQLIFRNKQ